MDIPLIPQNSSIVDENRDVAKVVKSGLDNSLSVCYRRGVLDCLAASWNDVV